MEVINLVLGNPVADLPSHQTVLDWVKKCGLSVYEKNRGGTSLDKLSYSIIMDNSITIGGEDLHVELAAPAVHPGHALKHSDVDVLKMSVGEKWNKQMISAELSDTIRRTGSSPRYVVSDNGRVMLGALSDLNLPGHRDISHTFGMFLEQVYGHDREYSELVRAIGEARKYGHTPIAHLMPPGRRAYARFMNVFDSIQWAHDIMQSDFRLPQRAREVFGFVKVHASLIEEMQEVMDAFRFMERLCKEEGLSHETAGKCLSCINATLALGGLRPRRLGELLKGYFRRECSLLESEDAVHNISSDVIESAFGHFKNRMSSCANHGFTSLILLMPLHFKLADIEACSNFDVRNCLEGMTLTKLSVWRQHSLMTNMALERNKTIKCAS